MFLIKDQLENSGLEIENHYIGSNLKEYFNSFLYLRGKTDSQTIIHAQYGSFCGFFTIFLKGKKVLSLRGSDWYIAPSNSSKEKIRIRLAHLLTRISIPFYDKIIVMSNRMKREVEAKYKLTNVTVITDGIDLKQFFPIDRSQARQEIEKDKEDEFWVLFSSINSDNPLKRFGLAKQAVQSANREFGNIEIKFMNNIPHAKVNSFVNSCDMILLTSTHEGYPNIIKEGLACNKPFVGTDVSDLTEIANSENGCFVCSPTISELSNSITKVYLNKKELNLRKYVEDFEISKVAKLISVMYQKLDKK